MADNRIIFFDGVCNLCNGAVDFIIKHDKKAAFKLAALQSEEANNFLRQEQTEKLDSIVLYDNGKLFTKSTAALRIAKELGFPWRIFQIFLIIPKILRDPVYDLIAQYRYKLFGKRDTCRLPSEETKSRFLSNP